MTALPTLRDILNNTPANAVDVDWNFDTLAAFVSQELINRDGSVSMNQPLNLAGPAPSSPTHAATKGYVDAATPVGTISMFAGAAAPTGYALCDGSSQSRTDPAYAALFAVIGTTYGAADGTHFNLPDLRARFPVGRLAADGLFGSLNQKGGTRDNAVVSHAHDLQNHTHSGTTGTESADHSHGFTTGIESANHTHDTRVRTGFDVNSANSPGTTNAIYPALGNIPLVFDTRRTAITIDQGGDGPNHQQSDGVNVNHTHSGTTGGRSAAHTHSMTTGGPSSNSTSTVGAAGANQNVPPYITINFIIRIGV